MKRLILGSLAMALIFSAPVLAAKGGKGGKGGNGGESMKGGLPALEDRVEADEALIAALQGQNNWAVVDSDGTLARSSSNGVSVATHTVGTGLYEVDFSKDVSGCAFVATLGNSDSTTTTPVGEIGVTGATTAGGVGVIVQTSDSTGTATDAPFHLFVSCP